MSSPIAWKTLETTRERTFGRGSSPVEVEEVLVVARVPRERAVADAGDRDDERHRELAERERVAVRPLQEVADGGAQVEPHRGREAVARLPVKEAEQRPEGEAAHRLGRRRRGASGGAARGTGAAPRPCSCRRGTAGRGRTARGARTRRGRTTRRRRRRRRRGRAPSRRPRDRARSPAASPRTRRGGGRATRGRARGCSARGARPPRARSRAASASVVAAGSSSSR